MFAQIAVFSASFNLCLHFVCNGIILLPKAAQWHFRLHKIFKYLSREQKIQFHCAVTVTLKNLNVTKIKRVQNYL